MPATIRTVYAQQILDSRGQPTLRATIGLEDGTTARAGVPSGASTGAGEAVELRDDDLGRYAGRGVLGAVRAVDTEIATALAGMPLSCLADVAAIDAALREVDGTPNLGRLGANAVVGVSMAAARAAAIVSRVPLWQLVAGHGHGEGQRPGSARAAWAPRLPVPHFNVINGGAHAANSLDFQEFMVAPLGAPTFSEALRAGAEVYGAVRARLEQGGHTTGLGDEGGFAPQMDEPEQVLALLVAAIEDAGYRPGREGVAIALDPAANGFGHDGAYRVAGDVLDAAALVERYADMVAHYPIWSIEDGLAEDDWAGWVAMAERLGERVQLVGDDIFVTDPDRIVRGVEAGIANAALIKVNQVGTLTRTLEAVDRCRAAGWSAMVSHPSGETTDDFIADLAVGCGCGQLKAGAPARGERVAKYNRLLDIAAETGLRYGLRR